MINITQLVKPDGKHETNIGYDTLRKLIGMLGILLPILLLVFQPLGLVVHKGNKITKENPVQYHYNDRDVTWYGGASCQPAREDQSCVDEEIKNFLPTISNYHEYYMRDIFVGILFILAAFLITYQGESTLDNWLSSLAGVSAILTAIAPCYVRSYQKIHYISACTLFVIFMLYCLIVFVRQTPKVKDKDQEKLYRVQRRLYRTCGYIILGCLISIPIISYLEIESNIVFWLESIMLWAFGLSWLTKGEFQKQRILKLLVEGEKKK